MNWWTAWWQQIRGYSGVDPWEEDPRIQVERAQQHERSNTATKLLLRDRWNERVRDSWRHTNPDGR